VADGLAVREYAGVWRLGESGRPTALVTVELYPRQEATAQLTYEFLSLTPARFSMATPQGMNWIAIGTNLKFTDVPDSQRPDILIRNISAFVGGARRRSGWQDGVRSPRGAILFELRDLHLGLVRSSAAGVNVSRALGRWYASCADVLLFRVAPLRQEFRETFQLVKGVLVHVFCEAKYGVDLRTRRLRRIPPQQELDGDPQSVGQPAETLLPGISIPGFEMGDRGRQQPHLLGQFKLLHFAFFTHDPNPGRDVPGVRILFRN
jgi:hypothetical protein